MNKDDCRGMSNDEEKRVPANYVYLIESPSPRDLMGGIGEGKLIQEALNLIGIGCIYKLAVDSDCFEKAIKDDLKSYLRKSEYNPVIHISAHGIGAEGHKAADMDYWKCLGIALTSGEEIYWDDLARYLTDINQFIGGKLLLCMSSCYGYGGFPMAFTRSKKLPYFALIGNTEKYDWDESAIAFATFYHQFFRKRASLEQAVEKMSIASGNKNFGLIYAQNARADWLEIMTRSKQKKNAKRIAKHKAHPDAAHERN